METRNPTDLRFIVPVTDCVDIAANEIRATLLRAIDYDPRIVVEPIAPVLPAFSLLNGNFVFRLMADHYPPGTLFLSTVNAEKMRPASIVGRTDRGSFVFIGRNHGIFDWLTRDFGLTTTGSSSCPSREST
jgi:hypothetical protein